MMADLWSMFMCGVKVEHVIGTVIGVVSLVAYLRYEVKMARKYR